MIAAALFILTAWWLIHQLGPWHRILDRSGPHLPPRGELGKSLLRMHERDISGELRKQ